MHVRRPDYPLKLRFNYRFAAGQKPFVVTPTVSGGFVPAARCFMSGGFLARRAELRRRENG